MAPDTSTMWIDVSAGVSGDMLLGALVDAGASLPFVQAQVDQVLPDAVALSVGTVRRAGMRATRLMVALQDSAPPSRTWRDIRDLLHAASMEGPVRRRALAVFESLARAEARVHDIEIDEVHFHEVGALDSIADVVGSCAAVHDIGVDRVVASSMGLGSGSVQTDHDVLSVPTPAVLELTRGWTVVAAGAGELATPTGAALVTTLASRCAELPRMTLTQVGVGAGSRDPAERANVVRVVLGQLEDELVFAPETMIEANVDDLDPRVWPNVLRALLEAGADDAWLTPIMMKKGRPAQTLHVLSDRAHAATLAQVVVAQTSTFGMRSYPVSKYALDRAWVSVRIVDEPIRVKIAHEGGVIRQATPEFADVERAAAALAMPIADVLRLADAAAVEQGLFPGRRYEPADS
jgi:pyridinium-3,5-bisthiocarboxylic acid mononucleotide nickel chelatase